jgi:hypothetical protein
MKDDRVYLRHIRDALDDADGLRAAARSNIPPDDSLDGIGFRVVFSHR